MFTVLVAIVSETKIFSGIPVFVSPVVIGVPLRLLLQQILRLVCLSALLLLWKNPIDVVVGEGEGEV